MRPVWRRPRQVVIAWYSKLLLRQGLSRLGRLNQSTSRPLILPALAFIEIVFPKLYDRKTAAHVS